MKEIKSKSKIGLMALVVAIFQLSVTVDAWAVQQDQHSSHLTIDILNETTASIEWRLYYDGYSAYLPVAHQTLQDNIADVEKGIEQLFLQDVQNIQVAGDENGGILIITFNLVRNHSDYFITGKYQDLYELGEYAPIGLDVLKVKIPEGKNLSEVYPGPNEINGSKLIYYDYNWIYPLEIHYSDTPVTSVRKGEEWKLPEIQTISLSDLENVSIPSNPAPTPIGISTYGINDYSKYVIPGYKMYSGTDPVPGTGKNAYKIADDYKPKLYLDDDECPPNLYYRIIRGYDPYAKFNAYLIMYYAYWRCQNPIEANHEYDYEPIFIWVRNIGEKPYRVAYDRFKNVWDLHVHDIHRTYLWSSTPNGQYDLKNMQSVYTQHSSYYPTGRLRYLQDLGVDIWLHNLSSSLQNNWDGNHVKLRIKDDYHTFDTQISGSWCSSCSLLPLDDAQLKTWYRILVDDTNPEPCCSGLGCIGWDVMTFKHDIADPFYEVFWEDPDFPGFPYVSASISSTTQTASQLIVTASVTYDNAEAGSSAYFSMRGLSCRSLYREVL
jgi:hypothetical protein